MPNRMLRDWTASDKVNSLSVHAERFFTRLIMKADDYGCFNADTRLLKANLFPLLLDGVRDADISRWMAECQKAGLIVIYEANSKKYLQIIDFRQRLDKARSKFPLPEIGNAVPESVNEFPAEVEVEPEVEIELETEVEVEKRATTLKISSKEKLKKSISLGREHPFTQSEFYDFQKFEAQFTGTDYEHCDLNYYFNRMSNWAAGKGVKRIDWIAQARNFMLGDANDNKLRLKNGTTHGSGPTPKSKPWRDTVDFEGIKQQLIRESGGGPPKPS